MKQNVGHSRSENNKLEILVQQWIEMKDDNDKNETVMHKIMTKRMINQQKNRKKVASK